MFHYLKQIGIFRGKYRKQVFKFKTIRTKFSFSQHKQRSLITRHTMKELIISLFTATYNFHK